MINSVFDKIDVLVAHNAKINEDWGQLEILLNSYPGFHNDIEGLYKQLNEEGHGCLIVKEQLNGQCISLCELEDYENSSRLIIQINKLNLIRKESYKLQFFYNKECFSEWLHKLAPFSFLEFEKIKIVVNGLRTKCIGPNIVIGNTENINFSDIVITAPEDIISKNVIVPKGFHFNYSKLFVNNLKIELIICEDIKNQMLMLCAASLCAAIVSEICDDQITVIIRGQKRVELKLYNQGDKISPETITLLKLVFDWLYGEGVNHIAIKHKLLLDRISLDLNTSSSLISQLKAILNDAFVQAKERYGYILLDRQDAYVKELRLALKEFKSQADLYVSKQRTLISNLMRDVLAGLLLVGFTLFTKFTEIEKLKGHEGIINAIFKGLAAYFIISSLMQVVNDIIDMVLSNRELRYWSNNMSSLWPKNELQLHRKKVLNKRVVSVIAIYLMVIILYIFIILLSWNFPNLWANILSDDTYLNGTFIEVIRKLVNV